MRIYVERNIQAPLEAVWRHTQDPALHQRWDLRFTDIQYLPKSDPAGPQQFRYATRLGFGLKIEGRGETAGSQGGEDGGSTSALRFWSDDPKSLIREGSGYWKYIPAGTSVRFLTAYDYHVCFGIPGRIFDRVIFRPLIGWATAWSFDRLALWLEMGITPECSLGNSIIHAIARLSVASVWIYHGLVPKLLFRDATESAMMVDMGISPERASALLSPAGWIEIAMGILLLSTWRIRWGFFVTALMMAVALGFVSVYSPVYLKSAFNACTLNVLMIAMCAVGWISSRNLPSAANCLRRDSGS